MPSVSPRLMDPDIPVPSPDVLDAKPSFRKPSNDAANRKYRRHSSADMSDSSSSDGSPKHERDRSLAICKEDRLKMDGSRRKNYDRDSNKQMSASYRDFRRHDECSRHQRATVEEERNNQRSFRSDRESRSGNHFEHARHESSYNRSRENDHAFDKCTRDKSHIDRYLRDKSDNDRYSRDKSDRRTHRSKEVIEYHRHNGRYLSSDRAVSGDRHEVPYKDDIRGRERDSYWDRGIRDDKRERQRSPGDCKNDHRTFHEGVKGHEKDSRVGRDNNAVLRKETYLSSLKEMDGDMEHKRKRDERDKDKHKDRDARDQEESIQNEAKGLPFFHERDGRDEQIKDKSTRAVEDPSFKKHKSGHVDKRADEDDVKTLGSSRQVKENVMNVNSEGVSSANSQTEAIQDFDAAKVAAMKAAELVNRNLIGGSFLSTEQKKKLLWGNKRNASVEESGNRWDLPLFTDRERQDKFNKLMGVKGDLKLEGKPDDEDGSLRAEKQKELQMDLEKQYTAGLRRRDGRTVGLGL
uniref:Arginine/serine-rich coiled-coil protein 2 n=2 Tax=Anthurium amnicola TaxID=1678845 RepID=A0A1D1YH65_9ARAE